MDSACFDKRQRILCNCFEMFCGTKYETGRLTITSSDDQKISPIFEPDRSWKDFLEMYQLPKSSPLLIHQLFTLANSGKCWIFDINEGHHQSGDFKDAILYCLCMR